MSRLVRLCIRTAQKGKVRDKLVQNCLKSPGGSSERRLPVTIGTYNQVYGSMLEVQTLAAGQEGSGRSHAICLAV